MDIFLSLSSLPTKCEVTWRLEIQSEKRFVAITKRGDHIMPESQRITKDKEKGEGTQKGEKTNRDPGISRGVHLLRQRLSRATHLLQKSMSQSIYLGSLKDILLSPWHYREQLTLTHTHKGGHLPINSLDEDSNGSLSSQSSPFRILPK